MGEGATPYVVKGAKITFLRQKVVVTPRKGGASPLGQDKARGKSVILTPPDATSLGRWAAALCAAAAGCQARTSAEATSAKQTMGSSLASNALPTLEQHAEVL